MIFYVLVTLSISLLPLLLIFIVVHNFQGHHSPLSQFHLVIQEHIEEKKIFLSDLVDHLLILLLLPIMSTFSSLSTSSLLPTLSWLSSFPPCGPPRPKNINNHCILHAVHPCPGRPSPGNVRNFAREIHFDQKQQIQSPNSIAKL